MLAEIDSKDAGVNQMTVGQIRNNVSSYSNPQRGVYPQQQFQWLSNSSRSRPPV